MASGALPRYSAGDLEGIAAAQLAAQFPGGIPVPVDIDYLLESQPGVTLEVMRGLRDSHGVAGAVLTHPDEDRLTVLIDEAVADGLASFYRFTLAEEFGHVILHRGVIKSITTLEQAIALHQSPDYYNTLDRNAKRLAAAVLMPADRLRRDAQTLFAQLRATNAGIVELKATLSIRLGQQYSVSTVAMRHRLTEWPVRVMDAIDDTFRRGLPTLP